ncbi:MAG: TolC family protein [Candidatus Kapaibacterium sp.]
MSGKKFIKKFVLAAVAAIALSVSAIAQPIELTLDKAIDMALENNRDTKVAQMEVTKARAAVDEAFGFALPTVDLTGSFMHYIKKPVVFFPDFEAMLGNATYSILFEEGVLPRDPSKFRPVNYTEQSFVLANSYEATAQVSQVLFNSAVFRGIGASQIYAELSNEQLKSNIVKTISNVRNAFYGVLLTKQLYEITKASYENAQDNLKNVRALNEQGLVSEFDALQAEVQVENIRPALEQMENTHKTAKDGLKILLGINQDSEIDLVGKLEYEELEAPSLEAAVNRAMEYNYEIRSLDKKAQVDEAFIDLDRAEWWPSMAAFGSYSFAGQSDDLNFNNYNQAVVGLNFSINLFKGGRTSNKVQQSTIAWKQTQQQLDQLKDFITSQVRAQLLEIARVEENLSAQQRNVKLAERAYDIAKTRYREGTATQLEVQNADMALRQARTNYLQSVYDYKSAHIQLDKLLGNADSKYFRKFKFNNQ